MVADIIDAIDERNILWIFMVFSFIGLLLILYTWIFYGLSKRVGFEDQLSIFYLNKKKRFLGSYTCFQFD